MKQTALFLLTVLLSTQAFSMEFNEERVTFEHMLSVHQLSCVTPLGWNKPIEDRIYTRLDDHFLTHQSIELKHKEATTKGCQLEALDELVAKAMGTTFGHVPAQITVVKETAKNPRIVFGECQRNYNEQIFIDLGNGITLQTSKRGILKPATGCR